MRPKTMDKYLGPESKTQSLASAFKEKFGGKWKYDGCTTWWCDDGIRHISRVAVGFDSTGEGTGQSALCLYYDDGRTPEWVR